MQLHFGSKWNPFLTRAALALTLATAYGQAQTSQAPLVGAVFTSTNDVLKNEVLMYGRTANGQISLLGRFATGGRGSGGTNDPLQSQYSVKLTSDHRFLLVVNAGSSDISVFRVGSSGLTLTSTMFSGGSGPISLAVSPSGLVYVVNYTGTFHTAGFWLTPDGVLQSIPNTRYPLSTLDTGASTAGFTPDGSKLVITERIANKVDVFSVNGDGTLSNTVFNTSAGTGPFGLDFTKSGTLLVSETNGGPPHEGTTTSYLINPDNTLTALTATADASGQAACWVTNNDSFAWVSDTATGNIGAYKIGGQGALMPIGSVASPGSTSSPIDSALSSDGKYFYVLYSALGRVIGYTAGDNGSLAPITIAGAGVPASGFEGLAAF